MTALSKKTHIKCGYFISDIVLTLVAYVNYIQYYHIARLDYPLSIKQKPRNFGLITI